jgi:hypothetical protein
MGVDPYKSHGKKEILIICTSCKQLDSTEDRSRITRIFFAARLSARIRVKSASKLSTELSNRGLFEDLVLCSFDVESCSYNYRNCNYGAASPSVGYNILANPNEVSSDPVLAFKTALWLWTTASPPNPSCHDVMIGNWIPSNADIAAGREPGFGETIYILDGEIECHLTSAAASNLIRLYEYFCTELGVSPGPNLSCASAQAY